MKRLILIAALLLGAAAPAAPAFAAQEIAQAQRQVPLSRVLQQLAQRYPGKQLNTTMGQSGGKPTYVIQWQLTNGQIVVFTVDAETGQQLG